jgi:hypothetical protein
MLPHEQQAGCEAQLSTATYLRYLCLAFTITHQKSLRLAWTFLVTTALQIAIFLNHNFLSGL